MSYDTTNSKFGTISGTAINPKPPTEYKFIPNSDLAIPQAWIEKDPNGKKSNDVGAKLDTGKTRSWLCISGFSRALEEVAKVTTLGAQKYTPNGWVAVPDGVDRYMEAATRHLLKLGSGEIKDTGPGGLGTYHKAQIAWNILASLELELRNAELPSK